MRKQIITAALGLALVATGAAGAPSGQQGGQVDHGAGWNNRDCYNNESGAQCQQRLAQQRSGNQTSQGGAFNNRAQQQSGGQVDHGAGWNNRDCYNWESASECQRRIAQQQAGRGQLNADRDRGDRGRDNAWNNRDCYNGESARDCRERLAVQQRSHRSYVWRDGRYEDRDSGAVAAGILGFILGAAIAGSDSDREYYHAHRHDHRWRDRCRAAYGDFDYESGTYVGRDGYRHYCTR